MGISIHYQVQVHSQTRTQALGDLMLNTKIYLCSDLGSNPFSCSIKSLTTWYQYLTNYARLAIGGATRNYFDSKLYLTFNKL